MQTTQSKVLHPLNLDSGRALKAMFREETDRTDTFGALCASVCKVIGTLRKETGGLHFVSAIISSDGPEWINTNMRILADFTDHLAAKRNFPVISAAYIFHEGLLEKYKNAGDAAFFGFWRKAIGSGVSTLEVTPRADKSRGARDEIEFCKQSEIAIADLRKDPELIAIIRRHRSIEEL